MKQCHTYLAPFAISSPQKKSPDSRNVETIFSIFDRFVLTQTSTFDNKFNSYCIYIF